MKSFLTFVLLLFLSIVAIVLQDLFSGSMGLYQTHLYLLPIVFCFAVLVLSFPTALCFSLITGLLEGLMSFSSLHQRLEVGVLWFVLFFMIWTCLLQFCTELTDGIRWELHALGSALVTATLLTGEWILISWHRGSLNITSMTLMLIIAPSAIALLLAPLFYYSLQILLPPNSKGPANRF